MNKTIKVILEAHKKPKKNKTGVSDDPAVSVVPSNIDAAVEDLDHSQHVDSLIEKMNE